MSVETKISSSPGSSRSLEMNRHTIEQGEERADSEEVVPLRRELARSGPRQLRSWSRRRSLTWWKGMAAEMGVAQPEACWRFVGRMASRQGERTV